MSHKIVLLLVVAASVACFGKHPSCHSPASGSSGQTTTTAPATTTTTASTTATPTCASNEVLNTCTVDCPSDYCAKTEAESLTSCSPPLVCPISEPICKCAFNERRTAPGGSCISVYDCPAFDCSARPNEVYNPCEPLCPTDDCAYAQYNGTCPPLFGNIGIVLTCVPKCTCAKGFWRNNGVCVPRAQCPSIQAQTSS